jgi:hypothetical protein
LQLDPFRRFDLISSARRHGLILDGLTRYTVVVTDRVNLASTLMVSTLFHPARHLSVAYANALVSLDACNLTRLTLDVPLVAATLGLDERVSSSDVESVMQSLTLRARDYLWMGEFGSDPEPVDPVAEILATLFLDEGFIPTGLFMNRPDTPERIVAFRVLERVCSLKAAKALANDGVLPKVKG